MDTSRRALFVVCALMTVIGGISYTMHAAALLTVRDLISTSVPSATSTHSIQFRTSTAIPASGKITINPRATYFTIPASFDYTDVDVAVSNGGPYVERTLAATPNAANDGVAVVTGTSGSITITLNSTSGIAAGVNVRILLGTNAIEGATGDVSIQNPSASGSYQVVIATKNASNASLDGAQAMIAIIAPVTMTLQNLNLAPGISNARPSGTIAAGNANIELTLETDELAACKYATTTGMLYANMPYSFSSVAGTFFYAVARNHVNNTTYTYYVKCVDTYGTENPTDFPLTFTLDNTPISNTSILQVGASGQGGVGPFQNGSAVLFMSSVRLTGWTSPFSRVFILKDGVAQMSVQSGADGRFDNTLGSLERGSYTFATYAIDSKNRRTATQSSALTLSAGSNNAISEIMIPPTIELEKSSIGVGEGLVVFGEAVPGSVVEVYINPTRSTAPADLQKFSTTSPKGVAGVPDGAWSIPIDSRKLTKGTYSVRARTIRTTLSQSDFTRPLPLGVGETAPTDSGNRSDINKDGKVNLVDFSILLSNWGTKDEDSDINEDGAINLADFSIMLFNWTG